MVEKINKAILRLMLQEPFYYYIFSNIDIEYTNNQEMKYGCDTAGVRINNTQLKYELINKKTESEINKPYNGTSVFVNITLIIHGALRSVLFCLIQSPS